MDTNGQGSRTDNWVWRVSHEGIRRLQSSPWEPRDPDGYLRRLQQEVPELDPIAFRYCQEALLAFNAGCYLASSAMLGVAAEQVFNGLAASFVAGQSNPNTATKRIADDKVSLIQRFVELRKRLAPMAKSLPDSLADTLTLDAVGDLLRVARNQAGHPKDSNIDEDTVRAHLQIAAAYLRKMTQLTSYFDAQHVP